MLIDARRAIESPSLHDGDRSLVLDNEVHSEVLCFNVEENCARWVANTLEVLCVLCF